MRVVGVILSFLLFFTSFVSAAKAVGEEELTAQVREVAKTLRCAVCQSESVWESNAELANQMREIIREKIKMGQSPDQIRTYFVSRYGDFILLSPRKGGLNWLLWIGPFALLIVGGTLLFLRLRKWTDHTEPMEELAPPVLPIDEQSRKRIEQELGSFSDS